MANLRASVLRLHIFQSTRLARRFGTGVEVDRLGIVSNRSTVVPSSRISTIGYGLNFYSFYYRSTRHWTAWSWLNRSWDSSSLILAWAHHSFMGSFAGVWEVALENGHLSSMWSRQQLSHSLLSKLAEVLLSRRECSFPLNRCFTELTCDRFWTVTVWESFSEARSDLEYLLKNGFVFISNYIGGVKH